MAKKLREIAKTKKDPAKVGMSAFVGNHMDNSHITHPELKKKFIKVFGQDAHDKHFEKLVTKHS